MAGFEISEGKFSSLRGSGLVEGSMGMNA